jgi:hypothetical protein
MFKCARQALDRMSVDDWRRLPEVLGPTWQRTVSKGTRMGDVGVLGKCPEVLNISCLSLWILTDFLAQARLL